MLYGRVDRLGGQLVRGEITNKQFELMRESSFFTGVALGAVELGAIALSALLVPAGIVAGAAYGAVEGISLVFASDAIRMNGGFQDDWSSPYVYATAGLLGSGGGALGGAARNARLGAVPLRQAGKALPGVLREEVGALASSARQLTREAGAFGRAARETLVGQPGAVRLQSGIDPSPLIDYVRGAAARRGRGPGTVDNFAGQPAGVTQNRETGLARELLSGEELSQQYQGASVQREQLLRLSNGRKALDPLTQSGRRLDHVVIKDGVAIDAVETTSLTANKAAQIAKEMRVRESGGVFVRDRTTRKLVDVSEVMTRVVRRQ